MRAVFEVAEGYQGPEPDLVLEMHKGVALQAADEQGPYARLAIGERDAGSLLRWLRLTFPGAEAHVTGLRCQECGALATVNLHLLGAEQSGHWCEDCVPPERRAEWERNRARGALPHETTATLDGVSYYLRSAYGMEPDEIAEALRAHPYTIATAASREMSVESVAVDIWRRWSKASARLQLEQAAAESGNALRQEPPR